MTEYQLLLSQTAKDDLDRLHTFAAARDPEWAARAIDTILSALLTLTRHPYTCRKAQHSELGSYLRELVIDFGSYGYVALFEITDPSTVTVLAVRHQREEDYH